MTNVLGLRAATHALSLLNGFLGRPAVPESSVYYLIAHAQAAQFDDAAFAGMYSDKGRPSYPPSLMLQVMLLAFHSTPSPLLPPRHDSKTDQNPASLRQRSRAATF